MGNSGSNCSDDNSSSTSDNNTSVRITPDNDKNNTSTDHKSDEVYKIDSL